MSKIRFGVTLPQFTSDPDRFVAGALRAVEEGFDSVWVFDHMWPLGGDREKPILECWTALAWLAARTDLHVGTLVTRASLRHPALLAKMAATVADIAPGRTTIAIGSGDRMNRAENTSYGVPYYKGGTRVRHLISTLEVVQRYLKAGTATLDDEFVSIDHLPSSPRSGSPPKVWVGGRSPELLEVAGRIADGWNGWGADIDAFGRDAKTVREIAGDREFEVSWAGQVVLASSDDDAPAADPSQAIAGGPRTIRDALSRLVDAGATHLIASVPSVRLDDYSALASVVRGVAH